MTELQAQIKKLLERRAANDPLAVYSTAEDHRVHRAAGALLLNYADLFMAAEDLFAVSEAIGHLLSRMDPISPSTSKTEMLALLHARLLLVVGEARGLVPIEPSDAEERGASTAAK